MLYVSYALHEWGFLWIFMSHVNTIVGCGVSQRRRKNINININKYKIFIYRDSFFPRRFLSIYNSQQQQKDESAAADDNSRGKLNIQNGE